MDIIGSALGFVGGLIGNGQRNKAIDKQLAAQKEENRLNREYNLQLAQMQNQWNVEQWERTASWNEAQAEKANQWSIDQWKRNNEYNSPTAVMGRLEDADLNADLIYGGGAGSLQSLPVGGVTSSQMSPPTMTSGAPSSPVDMSALGQRPTFGQTIQMALDVASAELSYKKIQSEIKKTDAETASVIKDTDWKDALNSNTLQMGNSVIKLNDSVRSLNGSQQAKLRKDLEVMDGQIGEYNARVDFLKAQTANMNEDTAIKSIERAFRSRMLKSQLREISARTGLTYEQTKAVSQGMIYQALGYNLDKAKVNSQLLTDMMQRLNLSTQGEQMELDLSLDRDFKELTQASGFVGGLAKIVNLLSPFFIKRLRR